MPPQRATLQPLDKGQACATCKARKVKCDAVAPVCGACSRSAHFLGEEPHPCVYKGKIARRTRKKRVPSTSPTRSDSVHSHDSSSSEGQHLVEEHTSTSQPNINLAPSDVSSDRPLSALPVPLTAHALPTQSSSQLPALPALPTFDQHYALPPLDIQSAAFVLPQPQPPPFHDFSMHASAHVNAPFPILPQSQSAGAFWMYSDAPESLPGFEEATWYQSPLSASPVDTLFSIASEDSSLYTGTPSPPPLSTEAKYSTTKAMADPVTSGMYTSWDNLGSLDLSWFHALPDPTLSLPLISVPNSTFHELVTAPDRQPLDWNGKWAADLLY